MEKNCLVTNLKATVNNSNLEYLDAFRVFVDDWSGISNTKFSISTSGGYYNIGGPGVTVKVISNGNVYHGANVLDGSERVLPATKDTCWVTPVDSSLPTEIIFVGLSKLVSAFPTSGILYIHSTTVEKIKYFDSYEFPVVSSKKTLQVLKSSSDGSMPTKLEWLSVLPLSEVQVFNATNISGDVSIFNGASALKDVNLFNNAGVVGNITSFGGMTSLASLLINGTNIEGTIESFVAAQRTAGRATGSVEGSSLNWGIITFNGSTLNAKGNLSWTASTITMNGVTIDA